MAVKTKSICTLKDIFNKCPTVEAAKTYLDAVAEYDTSPSRHILHDAFQHCLLTLWKKVDRKVTD